MKKLFKVSALSAIVAACSLLAVSCEPKTPETPTTDPTLQLEVGLSMTASDESSVTVRVSLQKDVLGYNYAIGQATDLEAFTEGTLNDIQTQNDPTVKDISFSGLTENTEYTVFVQAFAGEKKGKVQTLSVKTTEAYREPDLTLTMELENPTENSFVLKVNYTKDAKTIRYGYGTPDDQEAFEKGTLKTIVEQEANGTSIIIVNGLQRGTEYTVFAQVQAGDKKGNVAVASGKTYKLDLEIVLLKETLTSSGAQLEIRPSGDTNKFRYTMAPPDMLGLFESGQWLDTKWENDATQVKTLTVSGLNPDSSCTIMAQPFAENNASGKTVILTFKSLPESAE